VVETEDDETGWAGTAALRWPLMSHAALLGEALHIHSRRDAFAREGESPRQDQNILRLTLRLRAAAGG